MSIVYTGIVSGYTLYDNRLQILANIRNQMTVNLLPLSLPNADTEDGVNTDGDNTFVRQLDGKSHCLHCHKTMSSCAVSSNISH